MQEEETRWHPGKDVSDGVLITHALAGTEDAFETLVHRYRPGLLAFSCQLMHNLTDAEDIVQTVFLKLYLALPTLNREEPVKPWLFRVARNRCYDELGRKRAWSFSDVENEGDEETPSILGLLLDPQPSLEEHTEQQEFCASVHQAIRTLPRKYHAIVLLRCAGHFSFAEIADTLHIPESTAKTYMHRAKPLLRTALLTQPKE